MSFIGLLIGLFVFFYLGYDAGINENKKELEYYRKKNESLESFIDSE